MLFEFVFITEYMHSTGTDIFFVCLEDHLPTLTVSQQFEVAVQCYKNVIVMQKNAPQWPGHSYLIFRT